MAARNDITGDAISSRASTNTYRDNWDEIFKKKKESQDAEPNTANKSDSDKASDQPDS